MISRRNFLRAAGAVLFTPSGGDFWADDRARVYSFAPVAAPDDMLARGETLTTLAGMLGIWRHPAEDDQHLRARVRSSYLATCRQIAPYHLWMPTGLLEVEARIAGLPPRAHA